MTRQVVSLLVAPLLAGLLTVGCGSSGASDAGATNTTTTTTSSTDGPAPSTTTTGTDTPDAADGSCGIVSDDVVAGVLGVPVVRREPHGEPGGQTFGCIKGDERVDDPSNASFVSVGVIADGAVLVEEASSQPGSKSVTGLGDRAVFLPHDGVLFIAEGADVIQVQVHKGTGPGSQQDCVTVANDVLGRI